MIDWETEYAGYKKKIEKSYEIKEHFKVSWLVFCNALTSVDEIGSVQTQRAIELKPDVGLSHHLLGRW